MINMAQGRREASGKWHVARGRRHEAVMHEAAVCCCLEADTTKERDRERGRSEKVIDKTGAELDTPGRESSSTLGKRGEQGVHALSLRRDYVKKFVLTNDVADILCRVHCPLTNSSPSPHSAVSALQLKYFPTTPFSTPCCRNARVSLAPVCLHMCATDAA